MRPLTLRLAVLALMVCFAAGLCPVAASFVYEHPDEKHYTNAAITMLMRGDWLRPVLPDGAPRLQKPILAYWPLLVSYRLFGVGLFQSRLPSLLAAALVIPVSCALALTVTGQPSAALLAALMVFSQPHLILAATWALPDALLCLVMLVSAWGFVALLRWDRPPAWTPWAAYVGAGFAFATKGFLVVLFVAFVWLFAWRDASRGPGRLRRLVHPPSMVAGLAVATWWYAALLWQHDTAYLKGLYVDQFVSDTTARWWTPLPHVLLYAVLLGASLLPWSAVVPGLAASRARSAASADATLAAGEPASGGNDRRFERFVVWWSVVVVTVFSFSIWVDGRYLLPVGPLLAVALAAAVDGSEPAIRVRLLKLLLGICLGGFVVVAAAIVLFRAALFDLGAAVGVGAIAMLLAGGATIAGRRGLLAPGIAVLVFAAFPLGEAGLAAISQPDAGVREATAALLEGPGDPPRSLLVFGPHTLANQLLVTAGGRVSVRREPASAWQRPSSAAGSGADALVVPSTGAARLDVSACRTREFTHGLAPLSPGALVRAAISGRAREFLAAHRERYTIAVCG